MSGPSNASNWALTYMTISGSTISGPHSAVLIGGAAAAGGDDTGESDPDCEAYGTPGVIFRPRPPESVDTDAGPSTLAMEAMAARMGDGLTPMAWRELRLNRAFPAPKPGTFAFVGYGGGFVALDDTDANCGDQKGTIETLYCPYAFSNGVPSKAHAVVLDPKDEAISIIHGEGQCVLLQKDGSITMQSPDGSSVIKLENGKVTIQAAQIVLNGGAVVVGNPLGAIVPMLAGPASPPCPRLFVNPAA